MQLGGQFACSQAGADQEIIVSVGEVEAQAGLMFKSSFTYFLQSVPIDHSKGTKISKEEGWGSPSFLGAVG